jgi:NADPH2:quinone reductase
MVQTHNNSSNNSNKQSGRVLSFMGMNCIETVGHGGANVLHLARCPKPSPTAGQVRIRVTAFGLNRPDIMQRKGLYPAPAGASPLLGLEVAGVIDAGDPVAMAAAGLAIGDEVCALLNGGGYAEYALASAALCLPIPNGWTHAEAASVPEALFTAWHQLVEGAQLAAGNRVLIHGGSSGVGVMAIQLAKAWGASVIATAGTDEKCQACVNLGADLAINYQTQDFVPAALSWSHHQGVDVVLDMVAADYLQRNIDCMAWQGRLMLMAVQGGSKATLSAAQILMKNITIKGSTLRAQPDAFKAQMASRLKQVVWPWLSQRIIRPVVYQIMTPQSIQQAHECLETHQHVGKLVVCWS